METETIPTVPLNRLIPSPDNARKTHPRSGIEELADTIAAHGLLQNLQVRPVKGGKYEVVAGSRRHAALDLLAQRRIIPRNAAIACRILAEGEDPGEISLAENSNREPIHPADQFDAFQALAATGKGPEEIAARFGCTPAVVRQRMRLATVSPRLMAEYRAESMNLDQLMAFTVVDDHAAQEAAWFDLPPFNRQPASIRRALTASQVDGSNRLARFVGAEAYLAAGGIINRDLFQPEHAGYFTDAALLNRLAMAKLQGEAEAIRAEGWAWVEVMPGLDYDTVRGFGRAAPQQQDLTEADAAELDTLTDCYDELVAEHGDVPEPDIAQELQDLSERIDALSSGSVAWLAEDMARAGAIVGIGRDGGLAVERGLIKPEERQDRPVRNDGDGAPVTSADPSHSPSPVPLSDRLIEDLTAHRTAALRTVLADNATVALVAVVHAMALPLFYPHDCFATGSCLELRAHSADLRSSADAMAGSHAAQGLAERHAAWARLLPKTGPELWDWLLAQPDTILTGLLAVCAAHGVNAVRKPKDSPNTPRLAHADRLAAALDLDMRQWWQPTVGSYFGRVSKARILEAVTEAVSKGTADNLINLKKDALATRAEEKLAGTGWLPSLLRPVSAAGPINGEAEPVTEPEADIAEAA